MSEGQKGLLLWYAPKAFSGVNYLKEAKLPVFISDLELMANTPEQRWSLLEKRIEVNEACATHEIDALTGVDCGFCWGRHSKEDFNLPHPTHEEVKAMLSKLDESSLRTELERCWTSGFRFLEASKETK